MKRHILPLIFFLLANAAAPVVATEVHGHRGARAAFPENSLSAFEYAIQIGVAVIELDTGVTKDGEVVVYHDQKINDRLCQTIKGNPIKREIWIHQSLLSEIKSFDCGTRGNAQFPNQKLVAGTKIPTLREVLELVTQSDHPNAKTVKFSIETKSRADRPFAQPAPYEFTSAIIRLLEAYQVVDRTILQSFDHRTLAAAHQQKPELALAALFSNSNTDWITATKSVNAATVSPYYKNLSKRKVDEIHDAGLRVIPWTVNQESDWQSLVKMGVDGIITDDPEGLIDYLEATNNRRTK